MAQTQTRRWQFSDAERMQIREALGRLILGDSFDGSKSLLEQVQMLRSQGRGFLGLFGFLGSSPAEKPKEEPEWLKMPPDYAGGPEGWERLSFEEKRRIYEALKIGRKIYVAKPLEEGKRAMLDSDILQAHKLKSLLSSS